MRISLLVLLAGLALVVPGALAIEGPFVSLGTIDDVPRLLAPGLINTGLATRDVAMTPDGRELYFSVNTAGYRQAFIMETHFLDGAWTDPEIVSFSGHKGIADLEPALSPDGQKLFFYSTRPAHEGAGDSQDIWVATRHGESWSEPENLGTPVNTAAPEFFPSVTNDGTLYFCRADEKTRRHAIFRSRFVDGKYQEPVKLPAEINAGASQFNAWISPDESRIIVPIAGHPDNLGGVDYWLSTRNADDSWNGPVNLGPVINDGSGQSWSPYVSPDRKYFFFMSSRIDGAPMSWPVGWAELQYRQRHPGCGKPGIYVMKADFLDNLAGANPMVDPEGSDPASPAEIPPFKVPEGRYFGQPVPGSEPEIFAPNILSTGLTERDIHISRDGSSLMFGIMDMGLVTTLISRWEDGRWTEPTTAPWHDDKSFACFEPTLSSDGKTVLFLANRAAPGQTQGRGWANQNIFSSQFVDGQWQEPVALPAPVTTEAAEYFPSLATDGTLYFSREDAEGNAAIWMAPSIDGGYGEPVRLPAEVNVGRNNYNAFIEAGQKFIILCVGGHDDNLGGSDYWISFRDAAGNWTPAKNMGPKFNGPDTDASSAFLSPDGKVLFFSSTRLSGDEMQEGERLTKASLWAIHTEPGRGSSDLWWVDSRVLEAYRP